MIAFYGQFNLMLQILIVLGSLITTIWPSIIIMSWLSCYRLFCRFYCTDIKDSVFIWFQFLICMNYFQLLIGLLIFEVYLITGLETRNFNRFFSFTSSSSPSSYCMSKQSTDFSLFSWFFFISQILIFKPLFIIIYFKK